MATAETARLIASLELKDNMSKGVNSATASIGKLEGKFNRIGGIAQKGVSNAITNITRLGILGAAAVGGAVVMGIRSLGDLARATEQTNAVIASTGGKAGVSAAEVRKYAESLESLSTVDDKVIQDGENMLLTFTGIGKTIFPQATKAALNMAVAMAGGNVEQVDLKASAIQLGKALNDPVKGMTALRKVGVQFTEQQQKQIKAFVKSGDVLGAQKVILAELEVEFGKAAEAAGKGPEASWRRLQDVGEDLSQSIARGLLPVLTRAADWLSTKLADPAVVKTIDEIGLGLGRAGDELFKFVEKIDFKTIADSLGVAVGFAGGIVNAFMGMPDWIKTAVLTGWGLNKLTGGAVVDLGKLVFDQFAQRGASPANPIFTKEVGLGGVGGGVGAGGGLGLLGATGIAALIVAAAIPIGEAFKSILPKELQGPGGRGESESQRRITEALAMQSKILGQLVKPAQIGGPSLGDRDEKRGGITAAILERAVAAGFKPGAAAIEATLARNTVRQEEATRSIAAAAQSAAAAVKDRDSSPITNVAVTVNVTAAQVGKAIVVQRRFGPPGGSRERGSREFDD